MLGTSGFRRTAAALAVVAVVLAAAGWIGPARAGDDARALFRLDEIRFGLSRHSIEPGFAEDGLDGNAELLFGAPPDAGQSWLASLLGPRLHLGADLSFAGDTSRGYAGITWNFALPGSLDLELAVGGVIHDGPLDQRGVPAYGCRASFREAAGLGYAIDERWRVMVMVEHMSNADLCEHNRGLTSAGLRLGYSLD